MIQASSVPKSKMKAATIKKAIEASPRRRLTATGAGA